MPLTNVGGGHGEDMTWLTHPGNWTFPTHSPVLRTGISLVFPILRSCLKYTTLRNKCGVETCWVVYMPKSSDSLYINFCKLWQSGTEILLPQRQKSVNSFVYYNCHLPIWRGLPVSLVSPCCLCMGTVCKSTLGEPGRQLKKWVLERGRGKSQIGHRTLCLYAWMLDVDHCESMGVILNMPAGLMCLLKKLSIVHCGKERRQMAITMGSSAGQEFSTRGGNRS